MANTCSVDGNVGVGNTVRITSTWTNAADDNNPFDPTNVQVDITDPDGMTENYIYGSDVEVVRDGIGIYHIDQALTLAGTWIVRWWSDNPVSSDQEVIRVLS